MGVLALIVGFGMLVSSYVAIAVIISKAGYSAWWVLVPLSLPISAIVAYALLDASAQTGTLTFNRLFEGTLAYSLITLFLSFLNWAFLIAFAFSSWPALEQPRPRRLGPASPNDPYPRSTVPLGPWSPPEGAPLSGDLSGLAAAPPTPLTAVADRVEPKSTFCAWCASERPAGSYALHHCGPKDRPRVYCTACGSGLAADGACGQCSNQAAALIASEPGSATPS